MAQRKKGDRALVYEYEGYFLVVTIGTTLRRNKRGKMVPVRAQKKYLFTDAESRKSAKLTAETDAEVTNEQAALAQGKTISEALEPYPAYLAAENRPLAIETNMGQLRNFFHGEARDLALADLTQKIAIECYEAMQKRGHARGPYAFDTMLLTWKAATRFIDYCVSQKWLAANPLLGHRPRGETNPGGKGLAQPSLDSLMKLEETLYRYAEDGDEGAAAVLVALRVSLRATKVVRIQAGDINLEGALLRVPREARRNRKKRVPELIPIMDERLRPILASLKVGKVDDAWAFGTSGRKDNNGTTVHRHRAWLTIQVKRMCKIAGVSEKTHAHGMRGASSSLDHIDGKTIEDIQKWMGHRVGSSTLHRSYLTGDAIHRNRQGKMLRVMSGGKVKA